MYVCATNSINFSNKTTAKYGHKYLLNFPTLIFFIIGGCSCTVTTYGNTHTFSWTFPFERDVIFEVHFIVFMVKVNRFFSLEIFMLALNIWEEKPILCTIMLVACSLQKHFKRLYGWCKIWKIWQFEAKYGKTWQIQKNAYLYYAKTMNWLWEKLNSKAFASVIKKVLSKWKERKEWKMEWMMSVFNAFYHFFWMVAIHDDFTLTWGKKQRNHVQQKEWTVALNICWYAWHDLFFIKFWNKNYWKTCRGNYKYWNDELDIINNL